MTQLKVPTTHGHIVQDPPLARFLFTDKRASWIWLLARVWLGVQWVEASLHKITDPNWVQSGTALKGFWESAVNIPASGRSVIAFDWYRSFLSWMLANGTYTWFGKVVAYGELLLGVSLIIGAFVGVAAFFGAFMNWNFIMAGAASSNGLLLVLAVLLVMAWKVSGYLGADFFLLRWIGVPWKNESSAPTQPKLVPVTQQQ